ncbi:MAG: hypothetical protein HFP78_01500 [Methylococcales symbiont of Hymedesmia sp. n. MRB-2018]|nr:MAG: hypothetical protein HFP78_01500 [Methylococcales symbiont of Hymedesmia sp. n. MRB-2018]
MGTWIDDGLRQNSNTRVRYKIVEYLTKETFMKKILSISVLLLGAIIVLFGMLNFGDDSDMWVAINVYNTIVFTILGITMLQKSNPAASGMGVVMLMVASGFYLGVILSNSKFWLYIDILTIAAAVLASLLLLKTEE